MPVNKRLADDVLDWNRQLSRVNDVHKIVGIKLVNYCTGRQFLQCIGFDKAKKLGAIEEYKDAIGAGFHRPRDAWDKNYAAHYDCFARYHPK